MADANGNVPATLHPMDRMRRLRSTLENAHINKLDVGQVVQASAPLIEDIKSQFQAYMSLDPFVAECVSTLQSALTTIQHQHDELAKLRGGGNDARLQPSDPATPAPDAPHPAVDGGHGGLASELRPD